MTDITRLAPKQQQTVEDRRAEIIDELRQMQVEMALMKSSAEANRRIIERLTDRNEMLEDQLDISRQNERVVTRKLFRLAEAMSGMSKLASGADEIMKSVKEWKDDATEQQEAEEQRSAAQIIGALPRREDLLVEKPADELVDAPADPAHGDTDGAH